MSVPNLPNFATFPGAGSTGPFTFTFPFLNNSEIVPVITDPSGNALPAVVASLTGAGSDSGGSLTLVSALASGYTLTITRTVPIEQQTTLPNGGPYFAETIEAALDYLTMICQQLMTTIANTPRVLTITTNPNSTSFTEVDASAGPVNVQYAGSGEAAVWKKDATANVVTILPPAGWTIQGAASYILAVQYEVVRFYPSQTNNNLVKVG